VTASPSTITAQNTTALSAPSGWTGGTFSSDNTSVLVVSGSTGTGEYAGSATVTGTGWTDPYGATSCSLTGTTITVLGTYTIDPSLSATVGSTVQDHGYYDADGSGTATTTQTLTSGPTWSSSNTSVATISSSGLITCAAAGTATITSTYQGVTATGSVTCTVAKSCTISASPNPIVSGNASSLSWSSTGVSSCTWTSGLSGDAGISASSTSVSPVATTTYAISCDGGVATCSVTLGVLPACPSGYAVMAAPANISVGATTALSAPTGWTGGTFSSSNTGVLTVSGSTGTGVAAGTATVTGTGWNVNTGAINCPLNGTTVTVSQPTLTIKNSVYIGVGKTANLSATYSVDGTPGNNQTVTTQSSWSSSNSSVAASLGNGAFFGVGAGSAIITANYAPGSISATGTINVVQCKASDITLTLRSGINTPMANVPVTVSASAGQLTATSGTTDANGQFRTSLVGPIPTSVVTNSIPVTITATAQGVTLTTTVTFDPGSVCYSNQIGMTPTGQTFASLGNLFATIFPYVHPSVLAGMVWGAGWGR